MREWITCTSCEEEFKVISDTLEVNFCPLCGETIPDEEEDDDLADFFEEDEY